MTVRATIEIILIATVLHAIGAAAADSEIVWQNGFESADTCAWTATAPAVSCDPEMVFVPAGTFTMGGNMYVWEQPVHAVNLDAYWIDRTEVTVAAYAACVSAGGCTLPSGIYAPPPADSAYCNWGAPWNPGQHPIGCVTWAEAVAYCDWAGKRLPTEAEWEKAARGTDARTYPWGEQPPSCSYAVMYPLDVGAGCGAEHTLPVGSKPAGISPYGAFDMAGNVFEWVHDWYAPDYYAGSPPSNPTGPPTGTLRVLRSAHWSSYSAFLFHAYARATGWLSFWSDSTGFRCVRNDD